MKKIITASEQETFNLGREFGSACQGGEIFALCGDLGAGKTKLTQGLAKGLGVKGPVNSPTFNILKIYKINGSQKITSFCHVDAYRLRSASDLEALGAEEFFASPLTVSVIEWADKVRDILPARAKFLKIRRLSEQEREISDFLNSRQSK